MRYSGKMKARRREQDKLINISKSPIFDPISMRLTPMRRRVLLFLFLLLPPPPLPLEFAADPPRALCDSVLVPSRQESRLARVRF